VIEMKRLFITIFLMMVAVTIVSADTMIIYPTDNMNCWRTGTNLAWANIRDGAGTNAAAGTDYFDNYIKSGTTAWTELDRNIQSYNLSNLSGKTITGVQLSVASTGTKSNTFTATPDAVITDVTPDAWGLLVKEDYNKVGTILMGNYTYAGWSTTDGVYNNVTLNSAGVSYFNNRTGTNASIAGRVSWDYDNNPGYYVASKTFQMRGYGVGYTAKPFITVTYNSGVTAPTAAFTLDKSMYRIPKVTYATDTSTNTPTVWNWSWGDGTWSNGTEPQPSHKYTTRGLKSVYLICSNAGGSNTSATSTLRVVGYENYS
jgi:PKD repeat protein